MKEYVYTPKYVCSREIRFGIEDGKLHNVRFKSGCEGNLKAIGKLVEMLEGNDCQGRGTSCADQLSKAIREALEEEKN